MTRRRSIIGLCILCALAISAFAAQSASAAVYGATAYTCKKTGAGGTFTKGHCKAADAGAGEYSHVAIPNDRTTELTGTNEKTPGEGSVSTKLSVTIMGIPRTFQATGVLVTGSMDNHLQGEEHQATGVGRVTFTGVTVVGQPKCTVRSSPEGVIEDVETEQVAVSTKGTGMVVRIEPVLESGLLAEFWLEGAECMLSGVQKVFGTVTSTNIDGATMEVTAGNTTEQGTLHYGAATGPKAGLEGLVTLKARENNKEGYQPLVTTTTP